MAGTAGADEAAAEGLEVVDAGAAGDETSGGSSGSGGSGATSAAPLDVDEDLPWVTVELPVTHEAGEAWRQASELARLVCGPAAPQGELVEANCGEYLVEALPQLTPEQLRRIERLLDEQPETADLERRRRQAALREELRATLEQLTRDWDFLPRDACRVTRPVWARTLPGDPHELHEQLLRLISLRRRLEGWLGRLARLMRQIGAWRAASFASFGHYASERLGLAQRTLSAHMAMDGLLQRHPELE
ncbi:hypothetical protein FJY71_08875, partial [candidate division WOR-3 bacterium]|nr:hypothetical protein [candidate division WOR-3 bacterium]